MYLARSSSIGLMLVLLYFVPTLLSAEPADKGNADQKQQAKFEGEHPPLVAIRGTRVRLVRPEGFIDGKRFPGFQQDESHASVIVVEVPGSFAKVTAGFTAAELSQGGLTLKTKTEVEVAGRSGLLLECTQSIQGVEFSKWIVAFEDESRTAVITASCPSERAKELAAPLRACILSAELQPDKQFDVLADLRFTVEPVGAMKFATRVGDALAFSKGGLFPATDSETPLFLAGYALERSRIEQPKQFAERRLLKMALVKSPRMESTEAVQIDGLDGYESIGCAKDQKTDDPLCIYQTMLFEKDGQHYVIMQARAGEKLRDAALEDFKTMARSFKLKN